MFLLLRTHEDVEVSREEYWNMTQFFISMATRGVHRISMPDLKSRYSVPQENPPFAPDVPEPKRSILRKALALIGERGYSKVTLLQIAGELNMGPEEIYASYRSKEAVMSDLLDVLHNNYKKLTQLPAFQAAMEKSDPVAFVETLVDLYASPKDENTLAFYRIIFREMYFSQELKDYLLGGIYTDIGNLTRAMEELIDAGRIPPTCQCKEQATAFVYAMYAHAVEATVTPDRDRYQTYLDRADIIVLLSSLAVNGYVN